MLKLSSGSQALHRPNHLVGGSVVLESFVASVAGERVASVRGGGEDPWLKQFGTRRGATR
jgi:hypothetical protein